MYIKKYKYSAHTPTFAPHHRCLAFHNAHKRAYTLHQMPEGTLYQQTHDVLHQQRPWGWEFPFRLACITTTSDSIKVAGPTSNSCRHVSNDTRRCLRPARRARGPAEQQVCDAPTGAQRVSTKPVQPRGALVKSTPISNL